MSTTVASRQQVLIPVPLLVLSLVPLTAGALRLTELAGGPAVIPADDRFSGIPVALVVHIVGAAVYALVGAFQFVPRFRRRHLNWHRRAGRVLAVVGMLVVGSALWLTLFYPPQPVPATSSTSSGWWSSRPRPRAWSSASQLSGGATSSRTVPG